MLTFAWYLLKVIISSGILYAYYLCILRNKVFHRWNRFYILAAVVLSLAAPLLKINIRQNANSQNTRVVQLLQVVNGSDEIVFKYSKSGRNYRTDASDISFFIYSIVSALLTALLIQALLKIQKLKKANPPTVIEGINFISTNAKGTPFSFFNTIFWNDKIDISTLTGRQIFQHEMAHVREKHSYDKIFLNIVLIFCWCNPFFWLIRKELNMIHEFIADQQAVEDSDTSAFASMILQATYPQQQFTLTNNFFYSPLKRRLIMLAKNKNSKISYASRLLVLPLAALVFLAFTLKMKPASPFDNSSAKKVTVVIDAGHGGDDNGAQSADGMYEKEITLSIAKKIKELNENRNVNIVLSRGEDETITVQQRVDFARYLHADLFISIHLDAETGSNAGSGLGILIPNNDNAFSKQSRILASDISESFKNNYLLPVAGNLKRGSKGIWVLKNNQCPSIIVQAGFISTPGDLQYLSVSKNQQIIARNILTGIAKYAREILSTSNNTSAITGDTIHPIKKGAAFIDTKNHVWLSADTIIYATEPEKTFVNVRKAILIINGKIESNNILKTNAVISKKLIIHSGDEQKMLHKYGDAAKPGVFIFEEAIVTDQPPFYPEPVTSQEKDVKIFTKVETEAQFPGGEKEWLKYITNAVQNNINELIKDNKTGTCRVRFMVGTDGSISNVTALSMQGTKLAEVALTALSKGPKWIAAKQNDKTVAAYKEIPVTFAMQDDKVFTTVETEAEFPGGSEAWQRYIIAVFQKNIATLADENNNGTCLLQFIVSEDGSVGEIKAITMQNSRLAKVAINAIKNGPKWKPALQNGQIVASYKKQPFTFKLASDIVDSHEPK